MTSGLRSLLAPTLCTLLAVMLLAGLGVWQLERLAWKEALLARISERAHALPQPLPPIPQWGSLKPDDYEFRHVALAGTFDNAKETLILRASEDGPGYHVITPLRLADGGSILVDRGFVPMALKEARSRRAGEPEGVVRLTGLLRAPEPRNAFTPDDDDARGQFFTRDPARIAAHDGLVDAAPFSVDVDPTIASPGGWPKPVGATLNIPNNHLSYALTWFGLALGLLGVFIGYAWSRLSSSGRVGKLTRATEMKPHQL